MDVRRNEFQDLVGAYALDAVDSDEAASIDAFIAENADAAAEAERLRGAAAWLGAVGASKPPLALRDRLLAAAAAHVDPLPPVDALRRETARFETLLDSLTPADLEAETFNGLNVRDLVAHLAIVDEAFVRSTEPGGDAFIGADAVAAMTHAELPSTTGLTFAQVRDRYLTARRQLIDLGVHLSADARVGGYSLSSALVIRAFETWTHHHDIAVAVGRAEEPAAPPVIRTMADLAVQTLPLALAAKGYRFPDGTARVVLTGPGGGDWTVALGNQPASAVPDVVLRAPIFEFCQRFADRLDVDEVPFEAEGDVDLGRALVDAAPAFAGL